MSQPITARIPNSDVEQLRELAAESDRTVSSLIAAAVSRELRLTAERELQAA